MLPRWHNWKPSCGDRVLFNVSFDISVLPWEGVTRMLRVPVQNSISSVPKMNDQYVLFHRSFQKNVRFFKPTMFSFC
jgi:hypothetical protein